MSIKKTFYTALVLNIAIFTITQAQLDTSKYIGLDEIKIGDKAICHTVFKGQQIEKFEFEVVSIVKGKSPGRNAILMMGLDERFKHTNGISGASGSPMYINGRLAGALAFGWRFSKDPLIGVTPIEEMLDIGKFEPQNNTPSNQSFINIDYSKPIDLTRISAEYKNKFTNKPNSSPQQSLMDLPISSSLSPQGLSFAREVFGQDNVIAVSQTDTTEDASKYDITFKPGSMIYIPVVSGDISLGAYGTVTEVSGDKIYAFGHPGMGVDQSPLPICAAYVHTIVSSMMSSFKYAKPVGPILGSLVYDEGAGVMGRTDQTPSLIPLNINVKRYNDIERTYKCFAADTKSVSPMAIASALFGAVMSKGDIPHENFIEYKCVIKLDDGQSIDYSNITTGDDFRSTAFEVVAITGMLMNNPYKRAKIISADFDVTISNNDLSSAIRDIEISDTKISPGDNVNITIFAERYLRGIDSYDFNIEIPKDLKPGRYEIIVTGQQGYLDFIKQHAPHKFAAENFNGLVSSIKQNLYPQRNNLYVIIPLPPAGITLDSAELADLPSSKAIALSSSKRTVQTMPYNQWIQKQKTIKTILQNQMNISIEVQE